MKELPLADQSFGSLVQEEELFRKLQAARVCASDRLRLTVDGRRLFVDGFVESLDEKLQAERACRELAPWSTVVNRLRVAAADESRVS
jgi:hypothetical protein